MFGKTLDYSLALCLLLTPGVAWAGGLGSDCTTNSDCEAGLECSDELVAESCPSRDCPPGADCGEPTCSSESYRFCIPASCTGDADCGTDLVCKAFAYTECTGAEPAQACAPEEPCDEPSGDPPACEELSESYCVPAYIGPCTVDADCGTGFACNELESCWCSGSEGGGCACDPDDSTCECPPPEEPTEPECGCEPTGEFWCEAIETPCTTDADCPTDWSCGEAYGAVTCVSTGNATDGGGSGGSDGSGGGDSSDAPVPEDDCSSSSSETICLPPNWDSWAMGAGYGGGGDLATAAMENGVERHGSAENDEGGLESSAADSDCSAGSPSMLAGLIVVMLGLRRRRSA